MKRILAILLLSISGLSYAGGTILLGVGAQDNLAGPTQGTDTTNYNLKIIGDIAPSWDADLMINNGRNNTSARLSSQYEAGLRYSYKIVDDVKVYLRGELGSLQITGLPTKTYAGVEPGIIYRPLGGPVSIKTDYTWGWGLNNDTLDITMTRVQMGYDFTKENTIAIRRDWMRGDIQTNTWWIFLGHRF